MVTRSMRPPTPKLSLNCRKDIDAGVALAWLRQFAAQDFEHWATVGFDEAMRAEALLMGRGSDEYFGARWTSRPGEWADRLRSLPKYVVSSTLKDPMWTNATVLNGDMVEEVSKLKQRIAGEIVVYASASLVQTLIEKDLVDELPLTVYPVVLGGGMRLFGETTDTKPMRLVRAETLGENLTYLVYQFVRAAQTPMAAPWATPALALEQLA